MGDAVKLFTTLCYFLPGMPLIYTGQLSGNHHRLEFFEKDVIDIDEEYAQADFLHNMNLMRKHNPALFSPEKGAPLERIGCDNEAIFACVRPLGKKAVIAVMNMSDKEQEVTLDLAEYAGTYKCLCGKKHQLEPAQSFSLKPWQFKVFEK